MKKDFVPPNRKRQPKVVKPKQETEIPKDLLDQWGSVIGLSTIHKLLQEGSFPYAYMNAIAISLKYAEELREKALVTCSQHKDAALIPEIAEQMKKLGAQNVETTEKQ